MKRILSVEKINVFIGKKQILKNVNLTVNKEDFIILLGPNGSGKTTLLKSILGMMKINSGKIFFYDDGGTGNIRKKCGYVPQQLDVDRYFPIIAEQIINFGRPEKDFLRHLTDELKIKNIVKKPFGLLSGGERQKILLTMALAGKPVILFLDEPNLNLDVTAYKDFLKCVEKVKKEFGLTIIMVTHLISSIPDTANKIVVLKDGQIVFNDAPRKILKRKDMVDLIYG